MGAQLYAVLTRRGGGSDSLLPRGSCRGPGRALYGLPCQEPQALKHRRPPRASMSGRVCSDVCRRFTIGAGDEGQSVLL
jgi:hypothetical protein